MTEDENDTDSEAAPDRFQGKPLHPAGAGLGLIGIIAGFGIFNFSILFGIFWGVRHHSYYWFFGIVAAGYVIGYLTRRISKGIRA